MSIYLGITQGYFSALQQRSWEGETEALWPIKPKIFTLWVFTEKLLDSCLDTSYSTLTVKIVPYFLLSASFLTTFCFLHYSICNTNTEALTFSQFNVSTLLLQEEQPKGTTAFTVSLKEPVRSCLQQCPITSSYHVAHFVHHGPLYTLFILPEITTSLPLSISTKFMNLHLQTSYSSLKISSAAVSHMKLL